MDIEQRFSELSDDPKVSLQNIDALYLQIVELFSGAPQELNKYINRLKSICLARAIDHSKYRYRETVQRKQSKSAERPSQEVKDQSLIKSAVNIRNIVEACRQKAPFLSFGILSVRNIDPKVAEKFMVLYSGRGDENWIYKYFKPDAVKNISNSEADQLDQNYSWVVLCIFCPFDSNMLPYVHSLLDKNADMRILDLFDFDKGEDEAVCWRKHRDELFSQTCSQKKSMLISESLDAEQDCLIKQFFGSNVNFLVYSELNGGFSGASVILIYANFSPGDQRKYVIKICNKSDGKLKLEHENFNNFVSPYWIPNQHMTAEFKESSRYQAICYPFASEDTINLSIPLSKKYLGISTARELKNIVDKIFDHALCVKWRANTIQKQKSKVSIGQAFEKILNISKYEQALNSLLSHTFSKEFSIDRGKLDTILSSEIAFFKSLNHGDLRSDNIQVAEKTNEVFLIDFGLTGYYPLGFDYAALEASIRFNLLDYSVDLNILKEMDSDQLLKFDNLIIEGEHLNGDIDKAQKMASVIREKYLNDFSSKNSLSDLKYQYLFCLLALCLRQIQYSNLNRRYILQTLSQIIQPLYDHIMTM